MGRSVAVEVAVEFGSGVLIVGKGGTVSVGLAIEVSRMEDSAVD